MEYTQLGRTGLKVSRLCLGTMNFGPQTTEQDSYAIMDKGLDLGFNFFDTANAYGWKLGEGITEQIVGRWFAQGNGRREKVVLATKVYGRMGNWPNQGSLSALNIPRHKLAVEAYLDLMKRCLTDSIYCDDALANFVPYRSNPATPAWKRKAISALQAFLARYRLRLVQPYSVPWIGDFTERSADDLRAARESGTDWPARAHTMIGMKRLNNLQFCVETIIADEVPTNRSSCPP